MHARTALLAALALLLSGCVGTGDDLTTNDTPPETELEPITQVQDRHRLNFTTDGDWSQTLEKGPYDILDGVARTVQVEVPLGEGPPTQTVHMGLFLPDIPGCDRDSEVLPEECRVPVVADVGPYYGEVLFDPPATEPANRLGGFLIENLVPHGYAVAQVSVLGTGESTGCMDLMGEVEQAGVQAAVEALGTADWSNGNVGLIGRSYDGSTPWEAAAGGSEHLKTVVPISGLYGQHDLMWRNGSAESRGPGLLWGIYYTFTYSGTHERDPALQGQQIAENALCPETQTGAAWGAQGYATGAKDPEATGYWHERSFKDAVLENYEGSVYFIHGMQDWNVDPHMAFPFYQELEAKGLEMKGLFGQWGHMYPDRPGEHEGLPVNEDGLTSVRWDWAQDLKEWFDHYLKGTGAQPQLHVEVQNDQGQWRIEQTWPPVENRTVVEWAFDEQLTYDRGDRLIHPTNGAPGVAEGAVFTSQPLPDGLRLSGMPQLHVEVLPTGPGGQLYAALWDATADRKLGHAIMDLRYHQGGQEMGTVVPGEPITARMQFLPLDVVVPEGHQLELRFAPTGMDYLNSPVSSPVVIGQPNNGQFSYGDSVLRLPVVEPGPAFTPPGVE